uniref:MARVEL domain-containing protein n=1 Tax=Bursaphelenchus xylophilus TaxID=6326 RepID=A0A1I7RY10_BURXY
MYSMGVEPDKAASDDQSNIPLERCCFSLMHVKTAACLIAIFEVVVILYHVTVAFFKFDKVGDDYSFAFTLSIFSLSLATLAIILLLIGIKRWSAFFLIPHLLMQFTVIASWTFLVGYVMFLLIGGTSVRFDLVIYEDSKKGEQGLQKLSKYNTFKSTTDYRSLNLFLVSLLAVMTLAILAQSWCFRVVLRCFSVLRKYSLEKSSRSDSLVAIPISAAKHKV